MFRRRLGCLLGGGKMNEPVAPIDRRAAIGAGVLGGVPFGGGTDFVNGGHKGRLANSEWKFGRQSLFVIRYLLSYAAPRTSPPPGGGTGTPSAEYSLSLLRSVRIEMPRILAAC